MFSQDELARLIALQDRSYRLFLWLNRSFKVGLRAYDSVSGAFSFADAASAWIRKNAGAFPDDLRPAPEDLDDFASLFVSYLSTSFEVVDGRAVPSCRYCFCCGYLELPRHLRVRQPDRKARQVARTLKLIFLRRLGEELSLPLIDADFETLLRDRKDLREEMSLATYAQELFRRSRFVSQGEGVLVLWREFAWTPEKRRPKRKWRLTADVIVDAERRITEALKELAGP